MFLRDASATLTNTIVWGNSPREISIYGEGDPSFLDIFYANLAGGQDGIVTNDNGGVNWGSGNLTDDPLFTDPDQRDLSLQPGSPCIDAGSPDYPADPDLTRTDMGIIWFNHGERAIACDPQLITFDPIMPDSVAEHSVNISNTAGGYLRVYSSNIVGTDTVFAVTAGSGMFVVGPGDPPHLLTVRFNPLVVGDYQATLKIESNDPNSPSLEIPITGQALGVKQDSELPVGFTLLPIRPNPFNGEAIVRYSLPKSGAVRLEVYDLRGRRVRTVANGNQTAGWHTLTFSGSDLAGGIYMVRLTAGGKVLLGKAVLIK
jgi:hypothetical protein